MSAPPDLTRIDEMAREAIAQLPEPFRSAAAEVALRVEDWPPQFILHELGIDDPLELTGLYEGVPMTEKSIADQPIAPDTVWLFRQPILAEWRARGDVSLGRLVVHVTVHEFAHHFGWSDDDIATIDRWWE
ncbi:metallopeptidase family protein [Roseovarius salinarum]|uniref:metallopeptidase family protein n=1 Tax=Roseovarius salinarum TaxID=1981892 RepID=UPI000C33DBC4|nr:metallopeptidase family protein [Roseovarius salinarum]